MSSWSISFRRPAKSKAERGATQWRLSRASLPPPTRLGSPRFHQIHPRYRSPLRQDHPQLLQLRAMSKPRVETPGGVLQKLLTSVSSSRKAAASFNQSLVEHEHNFACHASYLEHFMRKSCLGERKPSRDKRLDLLLLKKVKQGDQILSKPFRFQPFECLEAIRNHAFPPREKPASGDAQREDGASTKTLTTTWAT